MILHEKKIGLKLYSTDINLMPEVFVEWKKLTFNYIELYIVPQTPSDYIQEWEKTNIPFVIHAAHSVHGINLAQAVKEKNNLYYFEEVKNYADTLNVNWIIVHGGNNGLLSETIRQISLLADKRIIVENKPKIGLNDEVCIGWSPDDFRKIADAGLLNGMALDFAHASCAALSENMNERKMIEDFMFFSPQIYHLSDGYASSEKDTHLNLGKGDRDIRFYINCIPTDGLVTVETPRDPSRGIEDFIMDVSFM